MKSLKFSRKSYSLGECYWDEANTNWCLPEVGGGSTRAEVCSSGVARAALPSLHNLIFAVMTMMSNINSPSMLGKADENFSHPHWNNLIHKSCQATVEHFPFCVYSGCGHAIPKKNQGEPRKNTCLLSSTNTHEKCNEMLPPSRRHVAVQLWVSRADFLNRWEIAHLDSFSSSFVCK